MQVEIDMKCMEIKFGTHGFSSFADLCPFLKAKFPFGPWMSKK